MKKVLLSIVLLFAGFTAFASDFRYLVVEAIDGSNVYVALSDMKITFANGSINIVNGAGGEWQFSSTKVKKFYFTKDESNAIDDILASDGNDGCAVYDTEGRLVGRYANRSEMERALPQGIYIIKSHDEIIKKIQR